MHKHNPWEKQEETHTQDPGSLSREWWAGSKPKVPSFVGRQPVPGATVTITLPTSQKPVEVSTNTMPPDEIKTLQRKVLVCLFFPPSRLFQRANITVQQSVPQARQREARETAAFRSRSSSPLVALGWDLHRIPDTNGCRDTAWGPADKAARLKQQEAYRDSAFKSLTPYTFGCPAQALSVNVSKKED